MDLDPKIFGLNKLYGKAYYIRMVYSSGSLQHASLLVSCTQLGPTCSVTGSNRLFKSFCSNHSTLF